MKRASKRDPFKPYVTDQMRAGVRNATVPLQELRRDYPDGYLILEDQPRFAPRITSRR